jgi:hypothetical protein
MGASAALRAPLHMDFLAREFSIDFARITGVSQEQEDQRVIGITRLPALRVGSLPRLCSLPRARNQRSTDNVSGILMIITRLSEPFRFRLTESMSGNGSELFPAFEWLKRVPSTTIPILLPPHFREMSLSESEALWLCLKLTGRRLRQFWRRAQTLSSRFCQVMAQRFLPLELRPFLWPSQIAMLACAWPAPFFIGTWEHLRAQNQLPVTMPVRHTGTGIAECSASGRWKFDDRLASLQCCRDSKVTPLRLEPGSLER